MTARDTWRWTDERGVQRLVGTDELRAALASAILPATTLVWREGMKEWAPASTVPELASAAFAGADSPDKRDASFDPRNTLERQRRATLVGLPTAAEVLGDGNLPGSPRPATGGTPPMPPVAVPAPGDRGARPPVTQVPPFGGPLPEGVQPQAATVPGPPRIPAPSRPPIVAGKGAPPQADKPKPKRRITSNEVDSHWATTTHTDEDDTIPRRARPSELAAAAAAAADATAALRDGRGRIALKPAAPARKPPPLPPGARPPAAPAITEPAKPSIRIKPPPPSGPSIEDLTNEAKAAPFKMGGHGGPALATTLTGVAPVPMGGPQRSPQTPPALPPQTPPALPPQGPVPALAPAPAQAPPAKPPPLEAPKASPTASAAVSKITRTLVSPRDRVDSISGLAEAIALADDPGGAVKAQPRATEPTGQAGPPARAPEPQPAGSNGLGRAVQPALANDGGGLRPASEALPLPPTRSSRSSRPPPLPSRQPKPSGSGESARPPPQASPETPRAPDPPEPLTAPFHTKGLAIDAGAADLLDPPQRVPSDAPPAGDAPVPHFAPPPALPVIDPGGSLPGESEGSASFRPPGRLAEQVAVPLSSLVGAGGLLISLIIGSFFVGRASSLPPARLTAHPALGAVPVVARSTLPAPPRPCWMVKQPARWAPQATQRVPFDAVATRAGTLAIGYAQDARDAMGIEVDVGSGEVKSRLDDKAREEIERVVPTPAVEFLVARAGAGGPLRSPIEVVDGNKETPKQQALFAVGLGGGGIALASPPEGTPAALWPLEGEEGLGAASVRAAGDRGFALVYRRGGAVWGGFIRADHKASGDLVKVAGSGGAVGKPAVAWNGREVAVIFADRPDQEGHYEIRVGHAAPGGIPGVTTVFPLPKGGPGGDAFAPDIAGLSEGRWLLMWTEGGSGARAVRAQTLTPDFRPLGDPIALSPPAGNYGQGVIGVVGDRAATVFLSKGASSGYELWGAVLQCGG